MGQILVKHRRGTTAKWIEWCKDESNILLDGEIGIEDLSDGDGNSNGMRLLIGDGMHHSYEELRNIIIPDSLPSQGYDYAEYFMWSDDVPEDDRVIGRFVTIAENTRTIRLAQPDSKVLGITTGTASVIGNYTEEKQNDSRWVQVGMLGVVQARHDGTCTENGYAMIGDNGVATLAPGPFGYKIVNVDSDNNTIEVVLGNDSDMISRIQSSMIDKPGVITEEGGLIFNDYENNLALGKNCVAMGTNCVAGTKGYYIKAIDLTNKKIYLTEEPIADVTAVDLEAFLAPTEADIIEGFDLPYTVGDKFSMIINKTHYFYINKIITIENNVITCDEDLPFTELLADTRPRAYTFWVPNQPDIGVELPFGPDFAAGAYNKATGGWSAVFGNGNVATDDFAFIAGNDNIAGYAGTAFGKSNKSLGIHATATGYETEATAKCGFTAGYRTKANGQYGFATGEYSEANGDGSFASGDHAIATTKNSVAFGDTTTASGEHSLVFGASNTSSGKGAFAGGYRSTASGDYSIAFGSQYARAINKNAIAIGDSVKATGELSVAIGMSCNATNYASIALGKSANANGSRAVAIGYGALAEGENSTCLGGYSKTYGKYAFAAGDHCESHGQGSTGLGNYTIAKGDGSLTTGVRTITTVDAQTAMGRWNKENSLALLMVGNGNSNTRKNAFEVLKDGTANLQAQGDNDNSVIIGSTLKRIAGITTIPTTGTYANNNEALAVKITALQSEVETLKSDLETALDNIIAIQESLIGGNE